MPESAVLQDLTSIPDPSPRNVGGKGAGLLHLSKLGLTTPPAWVITTETFTSFLSSLGLGRRLEALERVLGSEPPREKLEAVRETILAADLPEVLLANLEQLRSQRDGPLGGRIIVRSSATVEDAEGRSFAGIFESITCRSDLEVHRAILQVWASVFSPRAFAYYGIASLDHFPAMALVLQPFIEAERSGVMFTSFTAPGHDARVLVEHVEGDCEKLVSGQVNPDRLWMQRWPTGDGAELWRVEEPLPRFALDLAHLARELESKLGSAQDVEWCIRDEKMYVLQTRPITAQSEAVSYSSSGDVVLQGVGASPGRAGGAVHLVFNIEDADALQATQVLTATMTNPDMVPAMQRSAAIVTDVGGMICHAAIVSRELGVPCVVGTVSATQTLQADSLVTVDGGAGTISRGLPEPELEASPLRDLRWSDLWQEWQAQGFGGAVPVVSTRYALPDIPQGVGRCVLDPFCDLVLDPVAEFSPLTSLAETARDELLKRYFERLVEAADRARLEAIFLDLRRLDPGTRDRITEFTASAAKLVVLGQRSDQGPWQVQTAPDGQRFAILTALTSQVLETSPPGATVAIPLCFGLLLGAELIERPGVPEENTERMFGMVPPTRSAKMPSQEGREALHELIPELSKAHGGRVPVSDEEFTWLDVRPEVPLSTFLKAYVTPGTEAIPYVLGFDDLPLHTKFINCRFHFRQDTLLEFFPKLMEATWDEDFLSDLLQRCHTSYDKLDRLSGVLPKNEKELAGSSQEDMRERFLDYWRAFCERFSLCFFIQAQGDDCVFPALRSIADANAKLLEGLRQDWRIPGVGELSAPVTPVLTAEYMNDLLDLKQVLSAQGLEDLPSAETAIESEDQSELDAVYERVRERWHWMRERDPYYDPYDTLPAIIEAALGARSADPVDYEANRDRATLALALHFDLASPTGNSEKLVYAVKYGRALAIDRENHHIVWLRTSYRMRKMLMWWERRLAEGNPLRHRDVFFMQPWEILDAVAALPNLMPQELLGRIRNRRVAYEQEIQLTAGRESALTPQPEDDYY